MRNCRIEGRNPGLRSSEGTTLVELIVTLALTGLFLMAAVAFMVSSLRLVWRMETASRAEAVSDLLLQKIAAEITSSGGAQERMDAVDVEEGRLVIRGGRKEADWDVSQMDPDSGGDDWRFDDSVYSGYEIASLTLLQPRPDTHPNVIRIDLTLYNPRWKVTFSASRYAKYEQREQEDRL